MEYSKIKKSLKKFGLNFNDKIIKAIKEIHNEEDSALSGIFLAARIPHDENSIFDAEGLFREINSRANTLGACRILRNYFSVLQVDFIPSSESSYDVEFFYYKSQTEFFTAMTSIDAEMDVETGDYRIVSGEFAQSESTLYNNEREEILEALHYLLEALNPNYVLKNGGQ